MHNIGWVRFFLFTFSQSFSLGTAQPSKTSLIDSYQYPYTLARSVWKQSENFTPKSLQGQLFPEASENYCMKVFMHLYEPGQ